MGIEQLRSIHPPYVELLVLKKGQTYADHITPPRGFVAKEFHGRKCHTKAGLLGEFARVLDFPDYFGKNWDAFEECVTDLQWLPAPGYLFIITEAEQLLPDRDEEYETFLKILEESGKVWGTEQDVRPEIPFHVLFTVAEQQKSTRKNWNIPLFKK
ncbi:MAG TPA: barstar family protein [Nitrospiraceae bacterium]|nr:barstar family protein [Nitrospiraceae bacterium]